MSDDLLIAAGVGALCWLLLVPVFLLMTRFWRHSPVDAPQDAPPALVNLVVTGGKLSKSAFAATVLHLASRGKLGLTLRDGEFWCEAPSQVAQDGLADFERDVLVHVGRRLAGVDAVPLAALADKQADEDDWWKPFKDAVRALGRDTGLVKPRLSDWQIGVLMLLIFPIGLLLAMAEGSRDAYIVYGLVILPVDFAVGGTMLEMAGKGLLTSAGRSLAARWSPPPAGAVSETRPEPLAYAIAAGAPTPFLGPITEKSTASRPESAWSSYGGTWRNVPLPPADPDPLLTPHFLLLAAGFLVAAGIWTGVAANPLAGLCVAAPSVLAAVAAAMLYERHFATRPTAELAGQVIARWHSAHDGPYTTRIAVDDGDRAHVVAVKPGDRADLHIGDQVRLRIDPRSMRLRETVERSTPAPAAALSPEPTDD
ncbi:DUF2207 domain-containing protein [Spirillospora sp. NBC_00431]